MEVMVVVVVVIRVAVSETLMGLACLRGVKLINRIPAILAMVGVATVARPEGAAVEVVAAAEAAHQEVVEIDHQKSLTVTTTNGRHARSHQVVGRPEEAMTTATTMVTTTAKTKTKAKMANGIPVTPRGKATTEFRTHQELAFKTLSPDLPDFLAKACLL
jgi:hypothetical protein